MSTKINTVARRRRIAKLKLLMVTTTTIVLILTLSLIVVTSKLIKTERNFERTVINYEVNLAILNNKLECYTAPIEYSVAEPTIYNIPLVEELQQFTYEMCVDYNIPQHYELVLALMWQESNYTYDAVSHTDDYGIMQINKINHEWLREKLGIVDFFDPYQNIEAGVYLLSKWLVKYEDPHKALMCYAYGEAGAQRHWNRGNYTGPHSEMVHAKLAKILQNQYYN